MIASPVESKEAWQQYAEQQIRLMASTGLIFTSNEVWNFLPTPENGRWLGPVMQRLAREGVIVKVGEGVLSHRGHGSRMNAAWQGVTA